MPIIDDFNRASIGPDYTVNNLQIVDGELVTTAGDWGDVTRVSTESLPAIVEFDFYVPPDPGDGYFAYMVGASNEVFVYIDNSNASNTTNWQIFPSGWSDSHLFPITPDTFYRAKAYLAYNTGSICRAKIWERGTVEPANWQYDVEQPTMRNSAPRLDIYIDSTDNASPARLDNLVLQTFVEDTTLPSEQGPVLAKTVTLSVLKRRPLTFGAFIPPPIPDEEEDTSVPDPKPDCLPPCGPSGAGGSVNGWGSFKVSLTKCSECNLYFRSDSEFLGRGSAGTESAEHCGYCGPHNRDQHVTKLWVKYPSLPGGAFLMRSKMTWDVNGPDAMTVNVFNVESFPDTEEEGCEGSGFDGEWTGGTHVGRFIFTNDATIVGYIILGREQYKYQIEPAAISLDGNAMRSSIFRFELDVEDQYLKAKFRSATLEWPSE